MSNKDLKSLINDLNEGKLNLCFEAAAVIEDQDEEIAQIKETNRTLCAKLDEAQIAYEYAIGIHV